MRQSSAAGYAKRVEVARRGSRRDGGGVAAAGGSPSRLPGALRQWGVLALRYIETLTQPAQRAVMQRGLR
jgi:hypothetical protein